MARDHKPPAHREVDQFLAEVKATPPSVAPGRRGRLLFALDATASRQPTWDIACTLQGDMFAAAARNGGLELELCFYRGFREFRHSGWVVDGKALAQRMSKVRCMGGQTQIERVLRYAIDETRRERIQALVFVGDCVEEDCDRLCGLAGELGLLGTPMFVFHEGGNRQARDCFRDMARASGGGFAPFSMDAASRLKQLLEAVAVYATGGRGALEDFARRHTHAAGLLEDLR
ncbi:MAG: VWA domain-containing protein [Gammaproteobacteria bacterium]|nr:MAG: VWA domain-containing protein [Gammaproteobacteria bacterium]